MARTKAVSIPDVGDEAPNFNLPSAQGGQLRLSMRTVRGPVVVVFYRGAWSEEDVEYFKALADKEQEINLAAASVVGIGAAEPDGAREFARKSGISSYVLYDYAKVTTREWGLLEKDKERGEYARPATFIVGPDGKVVHAWPDGRPAVDEIYAKVHEITGLPKPPEKEEDEKEDDKDAAKKGEKPKKMSAEERERIKAERRAAREAGKSVKTKDAGSGQESAGADDTGKPEKQERKKLTPEEREKRKAERRAAREQGEASKAEDDSTAGTGKERQTGE